MNNSNVSRQNKTSSKAVLIPKITQKKKLPPPYIERKWQAISHLVIPGYLPEKRRWPCWLYEHKVWEKISGYENQPLIIYQAEPEESKWNSLGNQLGFYFKALGMAFVTG